MQCGDRSRFQLLYCGLLADHGVGSIPAGDIAIGQMCQCTTLLSNLMLLTSGIAVMLDESQYLWAQLIRLRRTPETAYEAQPAHDAPRIL
jgi:hypothetical protein